MFISGKVGPYSSDVITDSSVYNVLRSVIIITDKVQN